MRFLQSLLRGVSRRENQRSCQRRDSLARRARLGHTANFEPLESRLLFATYDLEIENGGVHFANAANYAALAFSKPETKSPPYGEHGESAWSLAVDGFENIQQNGVDHTITVDFTVGGDATQNVDYQLFFKPAPRFAAPDWPTDPTLAWQSIGTGSSVTLPQGCAGYGSFYIKPLADLPREGNESIRITLTSAGSDTIDGVQYFGRGEITDKQGIENELLDRMPGPHGHGLAASDSDCGCSAQKLGIEDRFAPLTGSAGLNLHLTCGVNMSYWSNKDTNPTISIKHHVPFFTVGNILVKATLTVGGVVAAPVYVAYDNANALNKKLSLALSAPLNETFSSRTQPWDVTLEYGTNSGGNFSPLLDSSSNPIIDTVSGIRAGRLRVKWRSRKPLTSSQSRRVLMLAE